MAPGSMCTTQIPKWESAREAHESGGGAGAVAPSTVPATRSSVTPGAGLMVGMSSPHSIEKWAGTIFDSGGRLSQIWNS